MYSEFFYIQLSALQHYLFCPRQCALAYIEQIWEENNHTVIGKQIHENVHNLHHEKRKDVIKAHGLYISSEKYGLSGQCDLVEFYQCSDDSGVELNGQRGVWYPFPVEYKKGKPKKDHSDKVQLCAQALCLEEMLVCSIKEGCLYYGAQHHRIEVSFDDMLRNETVEAIEAVHNLYSQGVTPKPSYSKKCQSCSLINICQPKQFEHHRTKKYLDEIFEVE